VIEDVVILTGKEGLCVGEGGHGDIFFG